MCIGRLLGGMSGGGKDAAVAKIPTANAANMVALTSYNYALVLLNCFTSAMSRSARHMCPQNAILSTVSTFPVRCAAHERFVLSPGCPAAVPASSHRPPPQIPCIGCSNFQGDCIIAVELLVIA